MKRFRKLLFFLGLLLFILLAVSQVLPSKSHVERSITIQAKPEAIHPWVNNLMRWADWTAWTKTKDPTLVYKYEGSETGVGAISSWDSKKMGDGRMALTESDPQKGVKFDLSFQKGKYLSKGFVNYEPTGETTKVTWGFDSEVSHNPLDRYFSLFMDKMVGPDFEEGLQNLKRKAEGK